jgi:hypothetical protein
VRDPYATAPLRDGASHFAGLRLADNRESTPSRSRLICSSSAETESSFGLLCLSPEALYRRQFEPARRRLEEIEIHFPPVSIGVICLRRLLNLIRRSVCRNIHNAVLRSCNGRFPMGLYTFRQGGSDRLPYNQSSPRPLRVLGWTAPDGIDCARSEPATGPSPVRTCALAMRSDRNPRQNYQRSISSLLKDLCTLKPLKHFLLLPPLITLFVKISRAVATTHIVCCEPFKALMAV